MEWIRLPLAKRFQSTLPRGERRDGATTAFNLPSVSIHAPARGATWTCNMGVTEDMFQSTLPRGERPLHHCLEPAEQVVSIHAPARGATPIQRSLLLLTSVSIHAPARGATQMELDQILFIKFQSTLPRGERLHVCLLSFNFNRVSIHAPARGATACKTETLEGTAVSIHAPARGATRQTSQVPAGRSGFNPRSRAGSDYRVVDFFRKAQQFQSTLPRGERLTSERHRA